MLSGLVCGLLMFVFACVFSEMMFGTRPALNRAVALGVGMQTMTVTVGALIFARGSGCRSIIAGPDINPVVFLAEAAAAIADKLCPESSNSGSYSLAPSAGNASYVPLCSVDPVPTVLVASSLATLMVGASFLLLGVLRLTEIVGYIPANVVSGFLSCIGYKVLKKSVEVACPTEYKLKLDYLKYYFGSWAGSWMFLIPALPIGLTLYALKRYHIGRPTVYFPFFVVVPTAVFYTVIYAQGIGLEEARAMGWLFAPKAAQNQFWAQYAEMYGSLGTVRWDALSAAWPSWIVMLLIVNLDSARDAGCSLRDAAL